MPAPIRGLVFATALSACLLSASACGGTSGPGHQAGCSPAPCATANGVTVTISNLDTWSQFTETFGAYYGPKFVWHIKNTTGDTLSLDVDGVHAFNSGHADISNGSDAEVAAGDGEATNGCPPRTAMRIPPHQTVATNGSWCVGVQANATAALLEFTVAGGATSGGIVLDVPLPASYGTQSDPCPSNQVLLEAIADPAAQVTSAYCKGDYVALRASSTSGLNAGHTKFAVARDDPVGNTEWTWYDSDPCTHASRYPAVIIQHLSC